jgi:hypothetical protein
MELTAGVGNYINVFASIIVMPCVALSFLMWAFHDIGMAMKNKDNWCMKAYKWLRKSHIPVGAVAVVLGTYHAIFATIDHGWQGIKLGNVTFLLFALGFIVFLLRKKIGGVWLPLHRIFYGSAIITMLLHCVPYLKFIFTFILPWLITGNFPT